MKRSRVLGIVPNEETAKRIVAGLEQEDFSVDDISLLATAREAGRELALEENTEVPERAAAGAGIGAVVGTGLGLLVGAMSFPIAGAGLLLAAGPIAAALGGAAAGIVTGGLMGALSGAGLTQQEAARTERELRAGNFLIIVHVDNEAEADRARAILTRGGAQISASEDRVEDARPELHTSSTSPYRT